MTATVSNLIHLHNPAWLTGPILDKELRVSSRRKRNYLLRFAYLVLLLATVVIVWCSSIYDGSSGSSVYQASRMAEIGRNLVYSLSWFQFIGIQLLAIVILSNAVCEEIHRGTYSVLMTTPITSYQFVAGKFTSRLLQLFLFLAISLPLLSILRVFGGVQWEYVLSSLSITLTGVIFVGALTLFVSVRARSPYTVILTMLVVFVIINGGAIILYVAGLSNQNAVSAFLLTNPMLAMLEVSSGNYVNTTGTGPWFSWYAHCLLMLGISLAVLSGSVWRLRRITLHHAFDTHQINKKRSLRNLFTPKKAGAGIMNGQIKSITGSPIAWKDLRRSARLPAKILIPLLVSGMFITYYLAYLLGIPSGFTVHSVFAGGLWLIAVIRLIVMAATSISREKEGRTWPLLLSTPMKSSHIIWGKAWAVFKRNMALWIVILIDSILFWVFILILEIFGASSISFGSTNFFYIILIPASTAAYIFFLLGLGIYFSQRCRTSHTAVILSLVLALGWYFLRILFYQFIFVFIFRFISGFYEIFYVLEILFTLVLQAGIGFLLFRQASKKLRHNIF